MQRVVGIDVGGANLKYACAADGTALASTFAMWRTPDELSDAIARELGCFGRVDALAVTMTGELADCFVDRQQGVQHIVQHVQAAAEQLSILNVTYYGVDGGFHDAANAIGNADLIAAANWHALASYVGKKIRANALLIDIGSTTTDIIAVADGRVVTRAQTDFDRLCEGSLVYVGCRRTPVCALVNELRFRDQPCGIMNEFFATTDDAMILLRHTPEKQNDLDSADGKPRTIEFAANRLARMIGLDRRTVTVADAMDLASQVLAAAKTKIVDAVMCQQSGLGDVDFVLSGHGQDLLDVSGPQSTLHLPAGHTCVSLPQVLGKTVSRAAPAYAVAELYSDHLNQISSS